MSEAQVPPSDAVRAAEHDRFEDGLLLTPLEDLQKRRFPTNGEGWKIAIAIAALKGLLMIAPFAGLLAPVGSDDFGMRMESDGFRDGALATVANLCFWAGAVGQGWVLLGWFREGRPRDTYWLASSVSAVVCAALALWWFPSLMHPLDFTSVRVPMVLTALVGLVAVVLQLVASSRVQRSDVRRAAAGQYLRSLPEQDQEALLAERREILTALRSRGLIDQQLEERAAAAPLGDWWLLDKERRAAAEG